MTRFPFFLLLFAITFGGSVLADGNAPSLVEQEVAVSQSIGEAEVAKAEADYQLAAWKLEQLSKLRERGHASWQEVAQQQSKVVSLKAGYEATVEHLAFVKQVRSQIDSFAAKHSPQDSEAIRLFIPGSARLVGWLPAKQTSVGLLARQLQNLQAELAEIESIDPSSVADTASKSKQHFTKLQSANHPNHAHLVSRAKVEMDRDVAALQLANAHLASAKVLKRRIALLESEIAKRDEDAANTETIALYGTPLVAASNNQQLASLTWQIAQLEANATKPLELLRQLESNQQDRVAAFEKLSKHRSANPNELKQAREQLADLQAAIDQQQQIMEEQKKLASLHHERNPGAQPNANQRSKNSTDAFEEVDEKLIVDATAVRHLLELHRKLASIKAARKSAKADLSYLEERSSRISAIDAQHRSPNELANAQEKVSLATGRIESIEATIALLNHETQRFVAQCKAQHDGNFQLVQVADGGFVNRSDLAQQEAILSSVALLRSGVNRFGYCGYLESSSISQYYSSLATNVRPRASAMEVADMMANGEFGNSSYRAGARSSVFRTLPKTGGLRLATDGITYPSDLFNYIPSDLWQLYPGYRSYRSFGYRGYGYVPLTYSHGIGRNASRGYGSTNFGSSYYGSQNYATRLANGSNGQFSFYGAYDPAAASRFYSRIPRYSDYYSFGIRRYDSPAGSSFRRGIRAFSPFYIPGSPTNFRF